MEAEAKMTMAEKEKEAAKEQDVGEGVRIGGRE
jgi:hypothetical protein